jgi:asparagine synthase (glutamine-hydrolysing)
MNGIAGVWNLDARPIERSVLATMSARLAHRGRDGERLYLSGPAGLACQHSWVTPEEQGEHLPLVGASGAVLVMDGRIDNRHDLVTRLELDATASDARCVLAAYDAWGEGFAERLNGDFALAILDAGRGRLILARDALGVRPLYYFHGAGLFAFGSEIKALLAHPDIPAQPDDEGVADFMLVGARPLDRQELTCFRGISSVVPAHVVVATRQALTSRRYWNFDTRGRLRLKTTEEYVEAFHERFVEAVRRRSRSAFPVAFSVSGGLDSSSIFCQLETLRRSGAFPAPSIAGLSYISDRTDTDEQHFLRDIERRFDVRFNRFTIETRTGLVAGAKEQVSAIEAPFVDYMWGVTRELHLRAAATGARSMLSGHWGDQMLFSSAYLIDLLRQGAWPSIWHHTREYGRYFGDEETARRRRLLLVDAARYHVPRSLATPLKWLRMRLFAPPRPKGWFAPSFLATALRHRYKLATLDGPFHSAHARAVYVEARSKYQVQCMEWNSKVGARYGLEAAFPFLDRDLIAFLMAIPGEMHAHHGVPRALLRESMRGILPDSIRTRTWKSDFSAFVSQGVSDDAGAILETLNRNCLAVRFGYLDPERLAPELTRLAGLLTAEDCSDSWDMADTYGLEVWLRVFLGGQVLNEEHA